MHTLSLIALVLGTLATLRLAVGLAFLLRYVKRAHPRAIPKGPTPPISLLKPLYGSDPGLEANLTATLRQNYPDFEVVFVHEHTDDPALEAVAAARAAAPDVSVQVLAGHDEAVANPKVSVLVRGEAHARHDHIAAADSDVRPDPLYLRDIANGLAEADAVSFMPVVCGARSLWSRTAALLINCDAILGILIARGRAVTGSTIGLRRAALEKIGGFRAVADRIADDYSLGIALQEAGCSLALARRPARLHAPGGGLRETARWAVRWARTIRTTIPGTYLAVGPLAFAPLLLLIAAPSCAAAAWLLAAHTLVRIATAALVDIHFCRDQTMFRSLPLLPLLWLLEPAAVALGLLGNTVNWRGRRYRLKGGRATLVSQ